MNIKGIVRNIMPFETGRVKAPSKELKSQTSTDREANGQRQEAEPERRKLDDAEIQAAIENLEQLDGVKNNHLQVKLINENNMRFVLITDVHGKVVRRIPERDLGQLLKNNSKDKGRIFDRAM